MKQVYLDQNVSVQDVICLDVKQAHHIFDVLRTTPKEKIQGYSLGMLKISLI